MTSDLTLLIIKKHFTTQLIMMLVMFRSSVLDRGPPGPRVFWEDRDRTKTDPQRPKDRRSFSVLKLADFLLIFGLFARDGWVIFIPWIFLSMIFACTAPPSLIIRWSTACAQARSKLLVICWASIFQ